MDGNLTAWDFDTGTKIAEQRIVGLQEIAVNLIHRQIWTADKWGNLIAFSIDEPFRYKLDRWGAHSSPITAFAVSSDGSRIASGDDSGVLKLWDTTTAEPVLSLNEHSERISTIAFSPNDRWLASGSERGLIRLRDSVIQNETDQTARWIVNGLVEQTYDIGGLEAEINQLSEVSEVVLDEAQLQAKGLKAATDSWLQESTETVSWAGASRAVYERAHRQIQAAIENARPEPWFYGTLALAEYRLGNYEEADKALTRIRDVAKPGGLTLTSPSEVMILHRLGRETEAKKALAQSWGWVNSELSLLLGEEVVQTNRRMLDEAKQELLGDDALDLERHWARRIGHELDVSKIESIEALLQSVRTKSDTGRNLVPYLIAEQLVRPVVERELVTARVVKHFADDTELPKSVRDIAQAMASQMATDPNRLYAASKKPVDSWVERRSLPVGSGASRRADGDSVDFSQRFSGDGAIRCAPGRRSISHGTVGGVCEIDHSCPHDADGSNGLFIIRFGHGQSSARQHRVSVRVSRRDSFHSRTVKIKAQP